MIYYNHQLRIKVFLISLIFNSSSFDPSSSLATSNQSSFWPLMKDADGCVICLESSFFPRKCVYLANRFLIDDSYLGRNILRPQCWDGAFFRSLKRWGAHTKCTNTHSTCMKYTHGERFGFNCYHMVCDMGISPNCWSRWIRCCCSWTQDGLHFRRAPRKLNNFWKLRCDWPIPGI